MAPSRYKWDPIREAQRAARQALREQSKLAKQAQQQQHRYRGLEADTLNERLNTKVEELRNILIHALSKPITISFEHLRIKETSRPFEVPAQLANETRRVHQPAYFVHLKQPQWYERFIPGRLKQYERRQQDAEGRYQQAVKGYQEAEAIRKAKIDNLRTEYERARQAFLFRVRESNCEIEELEASYQSLQAAYRNGDSEAVPAYISMALERSEYPEGFPQDFRLAYLPDPKELILEYELPPASVIPEIAEYKYIKTRNTIDTKARKPAEIKDLYQDIVASITLRTLYEIFSADQSNQIQVVVFNGFVQAVDPATGKDIKPHLISVRVTHGQFSELDLRRIDKRACLRNLGAQASPRPAEMQAVKPIVDFDMVDKRFVEQSDVLADLESRPNLMDLNPYEFENLVGNLFQKMGLETKLTRSSRDGGVDAVAYDQRPILGGKVVIQAKRYKHTVGVSAVRDLYGTMQHEGANKGILVTTSSYGPDAYEFIKDKPVELIDGGGLLYLLEQHAGIKARIVFPEEV
jgi:restriction system protein